MQALGEDPEIYEKLAASLAPSIWQMDDIKKGILCQLFGGCRKVRSVPCPVPYHLCIDGLRGGMSRGIRVSACVHSTISGRPVEDWAADNSSLRSPSSVVNVSFNQGNGLPSNVLNICHLLLGGVTMRGLSECTLQFEGLAH